MTLILEAGSFGPSLIVAFIAGLVVAVRTRDAARTVPFILGIVGLGQLGHGLGQHAVRGAVGQVPDIAHKVDFLNIGTGEAASVVVLSGACAVLLCVVAAFVSFAEPKAR